MHMSDALISPLVGGGMLLTSGGLISHASKKIDPTFSDSRLPLMGVMGAFVFAAQMINFAIPGTGSSGHIGGGMLLAILLGPYAGFLTLAAVLFIQALFFADGGLLAFGCNVFNLGVFTCFFAYPLIYKKFAQTQNKKIIVAGTLLASVVALQLGAFAVVLETYLSGKVALSFSEFLWFMLPIHLVIGVIEGIITGVIVAFLFEKNPEILYKPHPSKKKNTRFHLLILLVAVLLASGLSLLASGLPDGLEWALEQSNIIVEDKGALATLQEKFAWLPDYAYKSKVEKGTSLSGVVGSSLTLIFVLIIGVINNRKKRNKCS